MPICQDLADEIEAINAIYGQDTVSIVHAHNGEIRARLNLPISDTTFTIHFPKSYPAQPPLIGNADADLLSGHSTRLRIIRIILFMSLQNVFVPGTVCLFDLIDSSQPLIECVGDNGLDLDEAVRKVPGFEASQWLWTRRGYRTLGLVQDKCICTICLDEDFEFKMVRIPCAHHICSECFQSMLLWVRALPYANVDSWLGCCDSRIRTLHLLSTSDTLTTDSRIC